jgi:C-terminal processing protease CtpA/Prc
MPSSFRRFLLAGLLVPALALAQPAPDPSILGTIGTQLGDVRDAINDYYFPKDKVTRAFLDRCAATEKAILKAKSVNEAYGLVADTLASLDPRIRFYPPMRANRVDYSWEWQIIGQAAWVTQVDREGDAAKQGLQRGDRVLSIEGITLSRDNSQQVYYVLGTLAPRPGLRIQVQSPGQEPRWLAIASTVRPQRKVRADGRRAYTKEENRRFDEFLEPKNHVRRVGSVAVWKASELLRDTSAVAKGLKLVQGGGLVLDLRGLYVRDHEPVLRLLDGLFKEGFESGAIDRDGLDYKLRVGGDSQAFGGTVLVLVDSQTAGYAEVLARMIQQRQRGVIVGDRTMGRAFEELRTGFARGTLFSFNVGGVSLPAGEVVMADGVAVDGRGVTPDYQLLPTAADLAGRRDIVMSKALAMLKEALSPEEAYQLFPHYEDVDDDY